MFEVKPLLGSGYSFERGMPHRKESQLQVGAVAMVLCYIPPICCTGTPGSPGVGEEGGTDGMGLGWESHCSRALFLDLPLAYSLKLTG